jgi:hypothetical protein
MEPGMRHFSEDELAAMAITRVQGEGVKSPEGDHLRTCPMCSEKLDFFLQFYTCLGDELQQRHGASASPLRESSDIEVVIPFSVFQPFAHSGAEQFGDSELILAAKEMSNSSDRYKTVATFSCPNPPAVLRVLEDRHEHHYKIFVLSELSEVRSRVKVAITDDGGRAFAATTNEAGMAFITVPEGFDWAHAHVAVGAKRPGSTPPTTP